MSAPAWLFSFVDLAFLLLIAMTQVGSREEAPSLGEIRVPQLHAEADAELPVDASRRWQLRIHPRSAEGGLPFELVTGDGGASQRMGLEPLQRELARLHDEHGARPLLAPHRDSRSEDLLEAASALETLWPGRRRATISPLLALR